MKPKSNYKTGPMDDCATPPYAVEPLIKYINQFKTIWEPATGEGYLFHYLSSCGFDVIGTDLHGERGTNFLVDEVSFLEEIEAIVTNPPYSLKYQWIARCHELEKPYALLMPLETLGAAKAQKLFKYYGMEIILLNKRVNFKMPNKGWYGQAQFPVAWFTHGLNIGKQIIYETMREDLILEFRGRRHA